jgi:hypothetical protein
MKSYLFKVFFIAMLIGFNVIPVHADASSEHPFDRDQDIYFTMQDFVKVEELKKASGIKFEEITGQCYPFKFVGSIAGLFGGILLGIALSKKEVGNNTDFGIAIMATPLAVWGCIAGKSVGSYVGGKILSTSAKLESNKQDYFRKYGLIIEEAKQRRDEKGNCNGSLKDSLRPKI